MAKQMGATVQIINDKGEDGWIQVKFFDNDTLTGLLEKMGLRYDYAEFTCVYGFWFFAFLSQSLDIFRTLF